MRETIAGCTIAVAIIAAMTGCADATVPRSPATTVDPTPPASAAVAHVAVLATADDPAMLADARRRVLTILGDGLAGSVVVSPAGCFEGLPERVSESDAYLLAIQRHDAADIQALVHELPDEPRFVGAVTVICTD